MELRAAFRLRRRLLPGRRCLVIAPPGGHLPIYFGGASPDAIRVGGRHADVYAFWGEPLDGIRQRIAKVRASARAAGRSVDQFSVSLRPIAAETETLAWERAHQI